MAFPNPSRQIYDDITSASATRPSFVSGAWSATLKPPLWPSRRV